MRLRSSISASSSGGTLAAAKKLPLRGKAERPTNSGRPSRAHEGAFDGHAFPADGGETEETPQGLYREDQGQEC